MSWSRSPSAVQPFSSCYTRRTSQPELNEGSVGSADCAQVSRFPCLYKRQIVLSSDSQLSSASIISPYLIHANLHLLLRSTTSSLTGRFGKMLDPSRVRTGGISGRSETDSDIHAMSIA